MSLQVGISSFGRGEMLLRTVSAMDAGRLLVNVNDADLTVAGRLEAEGVPTVVAPVPQLFWQGMVALVENATAEWLLITSDEDAPVPDALDGLERFAEEKQAGVVATPIWQDGVLFKPSPASWAGRMGDVEPQPADRFHDLSGYISGTLVHRPTAVDQLDLIRRLGPDNDYVAIYAIPALVALIGRIRALHVYPHPVVVKGPTLPAPQGVRGADYFQPHSRVRQKQHLAWFINAIRQIDAGYAHQLDSARVYESRGWA